MLAADTGDMQIKSFNASVLAYAVKLESRSSDTGGFSNARVLVRHRPRKLMPLRTRRTTPGPGHYLS
jgi:hypothetical protein